MHRQGQRPHGKQLAFYDQATFSTSSLPEPLASRALKRRA
jgi:hypothetical protein